MTESITIQVRAKERKASNGRRFTGFYTYHNGKAVTVHFRQDAGDPPKEDCALTLPRGCANIKEASYIDRDGNEVMTEELWVSKGFKTAPFDDSLWEGAPTVDAVDAW